MSTHSEDSGLSLRDLVLEIREDVREMDRKVDHIEKEGSVGTLRELADHEGRIRSLERWRYAIPVSILLAIGATLALILRALDA